MVDAEDAAQAHGAEWRGRRVGAIGDVGTFSFQASKSMSAGEGGIMLTNDPQVEEMLWSLQNVGRRRGGEWYEHVRLGWNLFLFNYLGSGNGGLPKLEFANALNAEGVGCFHG